MRRLRGLLGCGRRLCRSELIAYGEVVQDARANLTRSFPCFVRWLLTAHHAMFTVVRHTAILPWRGSPRIGAGQAVSHLKETLGSRA